MTTHICTTDSLSAGVDIPPSECPFCKKETLIATWVDSACSTCGFDTGRYAGENAMVVRQNMGFSRSHFADRIGYSKHTIKTYEWGDPSEIYMDAFRKFVHGFYKHINENNTGE